MGGSDKMPLWNKLVLSALYQLDPETAHHVAIWTLENGLSGNYAGSDDPILTTTVLGIEFPNPVGLAAGFDKDARAIDGALKLGFGFVEAGTVTPRPQPGNPKPRLFRLDEDQAVINRFGFNSEGLEPFRKRLSQRINKGPRGGIVGANVGKNKLTEDAAADYVAGIEALTPFSHYLVVNLSSPNTPGLRALQAKDPITDLLERTIAARDKMAAGLETKPPLLAKIGPDLSLQDMQDIVDVALATGVDGLIVGNTTIERPEGLASVKCREAGGLSGLPLTELSTACLAQIYSLCGGKIPIIGCGGVANGQDAYAKIRAGASLVQLYSALVFRGLQLVPEVKRELAALLRRDGFVCVADAVGADHRSDT
jgi:dihydroorotate dehydrogenase